MFEAQAQCFCIKKLYNMTSTHFPKCSKKIYINLELSYLASNIGSFTYLFYTLGHIT